jgi:AAA15 family ATPase/GTPase
MRCGLTYTIKMALRIISKFDTRNVKWLCSDNLSREEHVGLIMLQFAEIASRSLNYMIYLVIFILHSYYIIKILKNKRVFVIHWNLDEVSCNRSGNGHSLRFTGDM